MKHFILLISRHLTRQHESLTGISSQTKLQFHAILDQVFPEYRGIFGDLYSKVSLLTLLEFPTSEAVINAGEAKVADKIALLCISRSEMWAKEKASALMAAASRNPFQKNLYHSLLQMSVKMIL